MYIRAGLIDRARIPALGLVLALVVAGCTSDESTAADASTAALSSAPAASSAASETASATASPSAAAELDADHIFAATVDGYAFVELPRSVERQARRQFAASAGLDEDEAKLDLRSLTKDGSGESLVLVVTLSPEYAALPGVEEGFVTGMAGSAGTDPEEIDLGAVEGFLIDTDQQRVVAWQEQNLLVAIFAERRAAAVNAARAIVEATG
jgi:hypothetical protein